MFVYIFFSLTEKYSFSESSSSVFRLVTRKESDLQLCPDVKAARSWKKPAKLDTVNAENVPFRCFKVLVQFNFTTFFGKAPTELSFRRLLEGTVLTYKQVLLSVKLSESWSHKFLHSRRRTVDAKSRQNVKLLYHSFLAVILIYNE